VFGIILKKGIVFKLLSLIENKLSGLRMRDAVSREAPCRRLVVSLGA
jgi:hypothetical protein